MSTPFFIFFILCYLSSDLCTGGLPPNPIMCSIIRIFGSFVKLKLSLCKRGTGGLSAVAGAVALDVHMLRHTLVIAVIDTFYRLAVDADGTAWMRQGTGKRILSISLLCKTFATGAVTVTGMLAAYHDITLAAQTILIIRTVFYNTF